MTTASSVARCTATSKGSPGPSKPSASRNTMRWALDEMGKNSVIPWMQPRITALRSSLIVAVRDPLASPGASPPDPRLAGAPGLEDGDVVIDHHPDELLEGHARLPPQPLPRPGRISHQGLDLRGPEERRIHDDMVLPVEPAPRERGGDQVSHRVRHARRDDVIARLLLLEHAPHGLHVVAREAPVPARIEVAEAKLVREAELDLRRRVRDLPGHELEAPARRLVVEADAGRRMEAVALPVVDRDPVAVGLGDSIR